MPATTTTAAAKKNGSGKGTKTGTLALIEEQRAAYAAWHTSARRRELGELRNAVDSSVILFPTIDSADYSEAGLRALFLEPEAELIRAQKTAARNRAIQMFAESYFELETLTAYLLAGEMDPYVPRAEVRISVGLTYYPPITEIAASGALTSTARAVEQDRIRTVITDALAGLGESATGRSFSVDVRVARSSRG